jgi:hypothetical protein
MIDLTARLENRQGRLNLFVIDGLMMPEVEEEDWEDFPVAKDLHLGCACGYSCCFCTYCVGCLELKRAEDVSTRPLELCCSFYFILLPVLLLIFGRLVATAGHDEYSYGTYNIPLFRLSLVPRR